jgi:Ca2+-binding EF-hand superfamily protein
MRAYKASDASSDGFISKAEWPYFIDLLVHYHEAYDFFSKIDTDKDRRITFEEFKKGRKAFGLTEKGDAEVKAEFAKIDTNGGGMILFEEVSYLFLTIG